MADDQGIQQQVDARANWVGDTPDDSAAPSTVPDVSEPWSNLWQVPTILLSLGLIAGAIWLASRKEPRHDFEGAFAQIEELIESRQLDVAKQLLEENVRPHLEGATDLERGRYAACAGDLAAVPMLVEDIWPEENLAAADRQYERSAALGYSLRSNRLERWCAVLLAQGEVAEARKLVRQLDLLAEHPTSGGEAQAARNRVLRAIIEQSLREPDLPYEDAMTVLEEYRREVGLEPSDQIWGIARQAELRLEAGLARDAVDHLLIDMRRVEAMLREPGPVLGELHVMLGLGYAQLGEYGFALDQVNLGLSQLDVSDPRRGDAFVALGRVLLAQSRFEEGHDAFAAAAADFEGTEAWLPALLGRAETHGILGRHDESQADFRLLAEKLPLAGRRRDVTPARIASSLVDRHDAALATARLRLAMSYIDLAHLFFSKPELPEPVLIRLASTHRAIAEDLLASLGEDADGVIDEHEAAVRREASEHFQEAAAYFVSHARFVQVMPTAEQLWADSLWYAADSYDLAGYYDRAIEHFAEYIAGRSEIDPRRIEAKFRLAQAHQATLNPAAAALLYEEVIDENPRSTFATRSHVPLAACYAALDRNSEAEQQLLRVVEGREPITPDALDYRDALVALGTFYYNTGAVTRAIEELEKASRLYPGDRRILEVRFRLADSYRRSAEAIAVRLATEAMPASQVDSLEDLREAHLGEAMTLFAQVADGYESRPRASLDPLQQDYRRYAALYQGDAAFELGDYERAIELYDQAARRFASHPSSVIALIQIVNAYTKMGDRQRALTAHNRVLLRLSQLPPAVLEGVDAILDEKAWRRWLEALPPGMTLSAANAGEVSQ